MNNVSQNTRKLIFNSQEEQELSVQEREWLSGLDEDIFYAKDLSPRTVAQNISKARSQCLKQLIQAALRERLMGDGVMLCPTEKGDDIVVPLWRANILLVIRGTRRASLGRYPEFRYIEVLGENINLPRRLTNPIEFLTFLARELGPSADAENNASFSRDIENTILNDTLCITFRQAWNVKIHQQATAQGYDSLVAWLWNGRITQNTELYLEQWATTGHPYHPCSKTKLGLTSAEVVNYSPEFQGQASVRLAAIRKEWLHVEMLPGLLDVDSWFEQHFSQWFSVWQDRLRAQDLDPQDFSPLPVHPWQAEYKLPELFKSLLNSGILTLLNGPELCCKSTMSFRTLVPEGEINLAHIKLPISVRLTSVYRTVSPRSAQMGPRISNLLKNILENEKKFSGTLDIVPEVLGMHYAGEGVKDDDAKHLSAIFRENPMLYIEKDEIAIPVAALLTHSPISNKPLFLEMMSATKVEGLNAARHYFRQYVETLLNGLLVLYLRYGIALEAHQQNTFAIFSHDARIRRVLVRDFGGIRIHQPTLERVGYRLKLHPDKLTVIGDQEKVREKLLHAVFQCHIGEMVLMLGQEFSVPDHLFWQEVANIVEQIFGAMRSSLSPTTWHREYTAIVQQKWSVKAFMRMRLTNTQDDIYRPLENPLASAIV